MKWHGSACHSRMSRSAWCQESCSSLLGGGGGIPVLTRDNIQSLVHLCVLILTLGHVESLNDQAASMFMWISFSWTEVMEGHSITLWLIAHQFYKTQIQEHLQV